ncbi:MAG: ArsA family ATPase [Deltaproteobacteria bacterium]|nr:ArsA family ATPase [Deltaproteobacteria bacterium]
MKTLLDKSLVILSGKGGVGKTLFSFVIANLAAQNSKKTLLCLTGNRLPDFPEILEFKKNIIYKISGNLSILRVDPVLSRKEYAANILKNRVVSELIFNNQYINNFLDAVPGLNEWAVFGKATSYISSIKSSGGDDSGKSYFDMVVFDSPATGHGLDLLRLPAAILNSVKSGRMRTEALERQKLLEDEKRTAIIPVTLLEQMPVNETIELITSLKSYGLPVGFVIVNRKLSYKLNDSCKKYLENYNNSEELKKFLTPLLIYQKRYELMNSELHHLQEFAVKHNLKVLKFSETVSGSSFTDRVDKFVDQLSLYLLSK